MQLYYSPYGAFFMCLSPFSLQSKNSEQAQRTFNGDVISDRQPLLVTGGIMRSYQIDGMEWMRGILCVFVNQVGERELLLC